ncbi:MAG: electron transfer flavoprotein subunit beta/FixA family protein, partial [Magnetococcales bacterium]|nr:electron transfer flavoprotein subunit beta/FixA family protein [Magnetococcales bacterium]
AAPSEAAPWAASEGECLAERTLLNPFDEVALEAALRFRESGLARQVTVVTVGPVAWEEFLRTALAMGADRALRVEGCAGLEPLWVARSLAAVAQEEESRLLLTGRQAVDNDHGQTGAMAAALLGWGHISCATELVLHPDEAWVRRLEATGVAQWAVPLPAVISVEWNLNGIQESGGPRYASLPNIMKARRKPLEPLSPDRWGLSLTPRSRCLALHPPAARPAGRPLASVEELVAFLRRAESR